MENKEVVSIVIPIYNVEAYLKQCLETIVNQTYPNLEIILVNDGSPDKSEEICKEFFKRDSRIRYVRQVNGGLSAARNTGIDLATGDYITFVDPDDWVTEDYVETLYTQLKKYEADVSIANYNLFNESTSKFLIKVTENDYSETLYEGREIIDQDAIQETRDMAWACAMMKLYKISLFEELRFPVGKNVEDNFLMYKLLLKANRVVHTEKCIYWYRVGRKDTLSQVWTEKRVLDEMEAKNEKLALLGMLGYDLTWHRYIYKTRLKRAIEKMEERTKKEVELRDYLIKRVLDEVPYTKLNGDKVKRLPNNVNFSFRFIEGESLLIMLDQKGICASSGSACTSGSLDPSHVLLAIGLPHEIAHGSLRLTLSDETTKEEIDYTVEAIKTVVERLRSMSPLYEDFVKKNKQ